MVKCSSIHFNMSYFINGHLLRVVIEFQILQLFIFTPSVDSVAPIL